MNEHHTNSIVLCSFCGCKSLCMRILYFCKCLFLCCHFFLSNSAEHQCLLCSSKILLSSFSLTGLVMKRSTPLAKASCCTLADAMPVSATMTAGRNPFARSKARMRRVDSRPCECKLAAVRMGDHSWRHCTYVHLWHIDVHQYEVEGLSCQLRSILQE